MARGAIRAGIGGWNFEPWRGVFYPGGLKQAEELAYAARHVTTIEINSTYYSTQKPESFAKWAAAAPEGFKFAVKASRFCTNRRELGGGGEGIEKFIGQGLTELGDKLGPILWQLMGTKKFDPIDIEAFFKLLPRERDGIALNHVIEPRHESFLVPEFVQMCRRYGVAICLAEHGTYPMIADVTGDVVYARLQVGSDACETCYPPEDLDKWAERFRVYAEGGVPGDLPRVESLHAPGEKPRDVYVFFIHEGKVRAPAGAMELIKRL
ncbi:MAG TPA: DUF72 domain-containing protein [Caulobacteraceae bacterium]|nr:DUF72 domain-containing protein [Caulobacteraceae bacterium]